MLPSSVQDEIPLKSSLKLAHVPHCILARVPYEIARAGALVSKKRVIHVKLKFCLRPLGPTDPYFKINLISCFLRNSWLARPAHNTAAFMSSSVWFVWLKWAGTGRSFLPLMTSLRWSRKRSANLCPVSRMYIVDGHLVHDRQQTTFSVIQEKCPVMLTCLTAQ